MRTSSVFFFFIFIFFHCLSFFRNAKTIDNDWKFAFGHASDPVKISTTASQPSLPKPALRRRPSRSGIQRQARRNFPCPTVGCCLPLFYSKGFDEQSHGYKPVGGTTENQHRLVPEEIQRCKGPIRVNFQIQFDGIYRGRCLLDQRLLSR